jgi:DnaJ-class molecular chaperone
MRSNLNLRVNDNWGISEAYRSLAQMYHPDKVAGLAPEFHEVAERRMKEINAAYQCSNDGAESP